MCVLLLNMPICVDFRVSPGQWEENLFHRSMTLRLSLAGASSASRFKAPSPGLMRRGRWQWGRLVSGATPPSPVTEVLRRQWHG